MSVLEDIVFCLADQEKFFVRSSLVCLTVSRRSLVGSVLAY